MTEFKIQKISEIKSQGSRCAYCKGVIDGKETGYRARFNQKIYHLSCLYSFINKRLNTQSKKMTMYKNIHEEMSSYMTQILAEDLTKNKDT
jgi:hypothetical protein